MKLNSIPGTLAVGFAAGLVEAERKSVQLSNMDISSIQFQLDRTDEEYVEAIGVMIGRAQRIKELEAIAKIDFQKDLAKEVESIIKMKKIIHRSSLI